MNRWERENIQFGKCREMDTPLSSNILATQTKKLNPDREGGSPQQLFALMCAEIMSKSLILLRVPFNVNGVSLPPYFFWGLTRRET
jgi:hypothetical protein